MLNLNIALCENFIIAATTAAARTGSGGHFYTLESLCLAIMLDEWFSSALIVWEGKSAILFVTMWPGVIKFKHHSLDVMTNSNISSIIFLILEIE